RGEREAGRGGPRGRGLEGGPAEAYRLGDVTDGDAAAVTVLLGAPADVLQIHVVGGRAEVEVHVDVGVELARHGEHAVDLPARIAVGVGRGADHAAAAPQ